MPEKRSISELQIIPICTYLFKMITYEKAKVGNTDKNIRENINL